MQTQIHQYRFSVDKPAEKTAYKKLCKRLKATAGRGHWLQVHGASHGKECKLSGTIELDTNCLFENQWNETDPEDGSRNGWRVFDWYEAIWPNADIRSGHYLDITDEMRAIRRNTVKCGYCGKMEAAGDFVFCPHCLDSEYLKDTELHLTRMLPVDTPFNVSRDPLTEAESATLLPLYVKAQTEGSTKRGIALRKKWRADVVKQCDDTINGFAKKREHAETERDGKLWILDHGMPLSNVIYYSHVSAFCFGWREPLSDSVKAKVLDIISEFPYPYQLKCADGSTLQGY